MIILRKNKIIKSKESLGLGPKIKESKIIVENFDIVKELKRVADINSIENIIENLLKGVYIRDTDTKMPEGSTSLWNIIVNANDILSTAFAKLVNDPTNIHLESIRCTNKGGSLIIRYIWRVLRRVNHCVSLEHDYTLLKVSSAYGEPVEATYKYIIDKWP